MRIRSACIALSLVSATVSAQKYEVRRLDVPDTLITDTGRRILRGGAAAGTGAATPGDLLPVAWDAAGTPTLLPLIPGHEVGEPHGINAAGTLVGASVDVIDIGPILQLYHTAVAWQGGTLIDLNQAVVTGPNYELQIATDVNTAGHVIGLGRDPVTSQTRAWVLASGTLIDLGELVASGGMTPFDLDDANRVAGYAQAASGRNHAVLWETGLLRDLHVLGGVPGVSSRAFGLNDAGDVVGAAEFDVGGPELERAALWPAGGGVVDLGSLGGPESWAHAIDARGDAVGSASTATGSAAAVLWRGGAIHDLNSAIPPGSGWYLLEARDIADDGRIVGTGNFQGAQRAFQLVPQCESCANHCIAAPNSTGQGAVMGTSGWESVSAQFFELHAGPVQPGSPGLFFYGGQAVQLPLGNGFRCVGGTLYRLPVTTADGAGRLSSAVDFANPPVPGGTILPGSTWHFQAYYRDPQAGGANFNLSDGLRASFVP